MPMYNLIEYSDNYSKTFGSLWPYCKYIPAVNTGNIVDSALDNTRIYKNVFYYFIGNFDDEANFPHP